MQPEQERDLWTPVAGILAAVTFAAGMILVANTPNDKDTDAQVLAFYADKGHRVPIIVGVYVLALCVLFLIWFGAGLRRRLRAAGGFGRLADIAFGGSIACAALVGVGAAGLAAVPAGESFGGTTFSTADVARYLGSMGFVAVLIFGMFAAIALIDATSVVIYRTGMLPRWIAWLGFLCALVLLFSFVFLPIVALPIWLLAVSIALLLRPATPAVAPLSST